LLVSNIFHHTYNQLAMISSHTPLYVANIPPLIGAAKLLLRSTSYISPMASQSNPPPPSALPPFNLADYKIPNPSPNTPSKNENLWTITPHAKHVARTEELRSGWTTHEGCVAKILQLNRDPEALWKIEHYAIPKARFAAEVTRMRKTFETKPEFFVPCYSAGDENIGIISVCEWNTVR
jgi:hypothetical protein